MFIRNTSKLIQQTTVNSCRIFWVVYVVGLISAVDYFKEIFLHSSYTLYLYIRKHFEKFAVRYTVKILILFREITLISVLSK